MSRGRNGNHLYVVGPRPIDPDDSPHAPTREASPEDALLRGLATSRRQVLATDLRTDVTLHLRTTAELLAERQGLRSMLAAAPPDRSHDVAALDASRCALDRELTALERQREELRSAQRTWRERRQGPSPELVLVDAKQADVAKRLTTICRELEAARASTDARTAFLAEHAGEVDRLDRVGDVLADRVDRAVCRAMTDPPSYLTSAIGMPGPDNPNASRWKEAATVIETYRLEQGITDERRALGPRPANLIDRWSWQQAEWDVEAIVAPLRQLDPAPRRREVGLDLGR